MKKIVKNVFTISLLFIYMLAFTLPVSAASKKVTAPATPTGLAVSEVVNGACTLSWDANYEDNLKGYYINSVEKRSNGKKSTKNIFSAQNSYNISLTDGSTYTFKIRAMNTSKKYSKYSSTVTATYQTLSSSKSTSKSNPKTPPATPTGLAISEVGNGVFTLSWDANSEDNLKGYYINSVEKRSNGKKSTKEIFSDQNSYNISLTDGSTYTFKIRAMNTSKKYSKYSSTVTATYQTLSTTKSTSKSSKKVPDIPSGLAISDVGDGNLTLTWDANSEDNLKGYKVNYVQKNTKGKKTTKTASTTVNSYTINSIDGYTYTFKVQAINTSKKSSKFSSSVTTKYDAASSKEKPSTSTSTNSSNNTTTTTSKASAPAAPTGLQASAGNAKVSLSWNANTEADLKGYNVFYKAAGGDWASTYTTGTSTTICSFTNGVQYSFKVNAVNSSDMTSTDSSTVTATPVAPITAPSAPTGLQAATGNAKVSLSWNANTETDLKGYNVSYKAAGGDWASTYTTDTSTTISSLTNGILYSFKVNAVNNTDMTSTDSSTVTATPVAPLTAPAAPIGLQASAGNDQVALSWTANTEADMKGYNVSYKAAGGDWASTYTTGTSTTICSLTNGVLYSFKVNAVNNSDMTSTDSSTVTATPVAPIVPPAAPTELQAVAGNAQVALSWNANTEADLKGYNISYQPADSAWTSSFTTDTSATISSLTNGTVYSFKVNAVNNTDMTSTDSSTVTATPVVPIVPPAAPTGLQATVGNAQVALTWTANSEANLKGYNVFYKDASGDWTSTYTTGTSTTINSLTNGVLYSFMVNAVNNSDMTSTDSSTVTATPVAPITAPTAPIGLQVSAVANGQVSLSWTANTEVDLKGYNVFYQPAGGAWTSALTTDTSYTVSGLTNGVVYSFKIRAVNNTDMTSTDSSTVTATPSSDVSSKVALLGQPFSKEAYARNVWDMQIYDGKVYLGHGNSSNSAPTANAGPVPVVSYNPDTKQFTTEYTVNEEQINNYKVLDGKLYIPGHDSRDSWEYGNYYVKNSDWEKVRTIPDASHVFDLETFNGNLYAATGSENVNYGEVMSSTDSGTSWSSEMPQSGTQFNTTSGMVQTMFDFKGKVYAVSSFAFPISKYNNILAMDGTNSSVQTISKAGFMPGASDSYVYRMLRTSVADENILYLGVKLNNALQWLPEALYVAPEVNQAKRISLGAGVLPTDIVVRGDTVYVLSYIKNSTSDYTNIVYQSNDLSSWSELFRFTSDTFARSFEELDGDFYFGLGCNTDVLPTSTGSILEVPISAYNLSAAAE